MRAVGSKVIVDLIEEDEVTASGIVIAQANKERSDRGTIVSVGPEVTVDVASGDVVVFSRFAGTEIEDEDGKHLVLSEDNLLAVLCDAPE